MRAFGKIRFAVLLVIALCALLAGCSSYGPKSLDRDQIDYGNSLGNSWKDQMLSNIVKIRYIDMPVFVDVGSIVSGYSLTTTVNGNVGFNNSFTGGNASGLGAGGSFTDRPTITYMPKTGNDYLRAILEPIQPKSLLSLVQAGYSSELLFTWAVESINGVHNWTATRRDGRNADSEFLEFTSLMQELQGLGAVGFEIITNEEDGSDIIFVLNKEGLSESTRAKSLRVTDIIGLDGSNHRFRVVYAPFMINSATLAMQTRSVIQMLSAMAGFVDVPAELASHASPGYDIGNDAHRPFRVYSGEDRPDQSFAAIKYEDYWYWIKNNDMESKRVFTLMLFMTTLTNQATDANQPVITIPTG